MLLKQCCEHGHFLLNFTSHDVNSPPPNSIRVNSSVIKTLSSEKKCTMQTLMHSYIRMYKEKVWCYQGMKAGKEPTNLNFPTFISKRYYHVPRYFKELRVQIFHSFMKNRQSNFLIHIILSSSLGVSSF